MLFASGFFSLFCELVLQKTETSKNANAKVEYAHTVFSYLCGLPRCNFIVNGSIVAVAVHGVII